MCVEQIIGMCMVVFALVGFAIFDINWRLVAYLIVRGM
jgi:membrane-bound ClpP family serine protease